MHNSHPTPAVAAVHALLEWIARDIERWLALFADDAIVEFPYAPSLGQAPALVGKQAIADYFRRTPAVFRGLSFRDLRVYATTSPDVALAEVHGAATLAPGGQAYEQDYVILVELRAGEVVRYREYWDPTVVLAAFGGRAALDALVRGA